jgi:lipoprotein-anchoring transpeptidase ErfK/SrfK
MRLVALLLIGLLWIGAASGAEAAQAYRPPEVVPLKTSEQPGTLLIDTSRHALYLVLSERKALRYTVSVGKDGFGWTGTAHIGRRAEWPEWRPPMEMIERAAAQGQFVPFSLEGGRANPLGARALYLFEGSRDTLYRIHGTNEPRTIGRSVTSGCIRMRNEDVVDLYGRVGIGTKVIVR